MDKRIFKENNPNYYQVIMSVQLVHQRTLKQAEIVQWIAERNLTDKISMIDFGPVSMDNYVLIVKCASGEVMKEFAKKFDIRPYSPSQKELEEQRLLF